MAHQKLPGNGRWLRDYLKMWFDEPVLSLPKDSPRTGSKPFALSLSKGLNIGK